MHIHSTSMHACMHACIRTYLPILHLTYLHKPLTAAHSGRWWGKDTAYVLEVKGEGHVEVSMWMEGGNCSSHYNILTLVSLS